MAVVILALCLNVTTATLASNIIDPGDNHYSVPEALFDFDTTGCIPPVPADFFGPGSDPFEGQVACQGDPSNNGVDTVIRRTASGSVPPPYPAPATIPIEIIELSLVSTAPITVSFDGGLNSESWDVEVDLSSSPISPAQTGTMSVTKTHANGGVFRTEINVQPRFTFTRQSDGQTEVWDTGLQGITPTKYNDASPYPWVEPPIGNGFKPSGNYPLGLNSGGCTLALIPNNSIKWSQPPDPSVSGLHSHNYQTYWIKVADDFQCLGGDIIKIRWYGCYETNLGQEIRGLGVGSFHLSLHTCNSVPTPWHLPQDPELLQSMNAPFIQCNETDTGMVNIVGAKIYSYEYVLPIPYAQIAGTWYWLDVMAQSNDPFDYALWCWQEAQRAPAPAGPLGHAPAAGSSDSTLWSSSIWPPYGEEERYSDMAFEIISADTTDDNYREYGDAPEGVRAYSMGGGVTGTFPTCKNVAVAGYIEHNNFGAFFGGPLTMAGFDFETEGNGGICASFSPYDNDECFADGDAGLLIPDSATIVGGVETLCPQSQGISLGQTCATAVWGTDIDIEVTNFMPNDTTGYVNVLMDFNQGGNWGGSAASAVCTAAEWVLKDHPVPNGFVGPLSALTPPGFTIGPNSGYVWARFSITEVPIGTVPGGLDITDWDGSGVFEDGETEDYLLRIDPTTQTDDLDWGDAPEPAGGGGYPTTSGNSGANHVIAGPYLDDGTGTDGPDSEPDGQPDGSATGDDTDANGDDEDGVLITPLPLVPGGFATLSFTVAGAPGCVDAWIDWNQDQVWDDSAGSNEKVSGACFAVGPGLLNILVPASALPGQTFARIRISTTGGLPPTGGASDGEVEDHEVFVKDLPDPALKFQQLPLDGPDFYGHDEISTAYTAWDFTDLQIPFEVGYDGCYMADDFADFKHSPVIKVRWWGSYPENLDEESVPRFLIAFETDVPANAIEQMPSHPGDLLYSEIVHRGGDLTAPLNPGEFSEILVSNGGAPCNENLYEYEAILQNPFPQDPNTVYWLKIVALYDIGPEIQSLLDCIAGAGYDLCSFLNLPRQTQLGICDEVILPRWGWHNRDYTIMDPYASKASDLATGPGEHLAGYVFDPDLGDIEVWHFQDDAVSGHVFIDPFNPQFPEYPESPDVRQQDYRDENYVFAWLWCGTSPPYVDGPGPSAQNPEGIADFSKDLAFELWTNDECFPSTDPGYANWLLHGKPRCWCYPRQCYGDADGKVQGAGGPGFRWVYIGDLNIFSVAYGVKEPPKGPGIATRFGPLGDLGICGDFAHDVQGAAGPGFRYVYTNDLNIFSLYYGAKEPPKTQVGRITPPTDCP
jgi:hypothetical protein